MIQFAILTWRLTLILLVKTIKEHIEPHSANIAVANVWQSPGKRFQQKFISTS